VWGGFVPPKELQLAAWLLCILCSCEVVKGFGRH
jgi:hypothetical protein